MACHQYLFGGESSGTEELRPLYKAAFFILQLIEYLRSGEYRRTKAALAQHLTGEEKLLPETDMKWDEYKNDIPQTLLFTTNG